MDFKAIKTSFKDMPKVGEAPKPSEPLAWTVYRSGDRIRARLHPADQPLVVIHDGEILHPENFLKLLVEWCHE